MAAYSPSSPHYRVVWARDGVANCIASGLVMSVAIYATSLVILSILQCLDAAVDVEAVALLVFSLAAVAVGARAAWTGMRACMAAADMVVVRRGMEGWAPRGETVAGSARATAE